MQLRYHDDVGEFAALAGALYRRDPVAHTIELTLLLRSARIPPDSLLLTVWDGGELCGAALQTPPYPLSCGAVPLDAVTAVAGELARSHPQLTGVRGQRAVTVAFADAWRAVTGSPTEVTVEERLYRLGDLRPPSGVAGSVRDAGSGDMHLLVDWVEMFFGETFGHPRDLQAGARFVESAWETGDRFLLWVVDTTPVSVAMLRAPASGVARIGPVFTPGDSRGRGYASAVTAAAARSALEDGVADVVLFTDLANPVSNAIYQRIGFQPVHDSIRIDFTPG